MSSGSIEEKDDQDVIIEVRHEQNFNQIISEIVVPFSEFLENGKIPDIYSGYEKIAFNQRHPTYKSLMRLEFEKAIREYEISKIKEFIL